MYFDGDLAGETAFTANLSSSNPIHFTSTVQLAGTLTISTSTAFDLSGEGPFSFGSVTSAAQHNFTGLEGRVLSISALAANSIIGVGTGIDLRLGSVGNGARVNLLGAGPWTVQGPASGTAVDLDGVLTPAATGSITLGGLLKLGDLGTTFSSVTLLEGAVLTGTTFDPSVTLSGAGCVVYGGRSWKEKVALWTDASAADSFMTVREFSPSVDQSKISASKILWWYDCRKTENAYNEKAFAMCRFAASSASSIANYPDMYPDIIPNTLNGKAIVKCSNNAQTRMGLISASARIIDNYSDWTPVNTVYAMVVARNVKSSNGAALLTTADGSLAASATGYNANIFTNESLTVYRNGTLVDQTATTWGQSVWGVYSFTAGGASVRGLASLTNPGSSSDGNGGFDYAEIMLFTEAPTETERKVAEEYLAAKWGLPCVHSDTREAVSLKLAVSGATASALVDHQLDDTPHAFTVNLDFGSGTVRGARYPILKCQAGDTYALGEVTGARRASEVALEYDSETGTLYAAIPITGLRVIVR